ncbi:hypothetical protein EAT69_23460, partial [Salmonella enterica]|nr:hypothetical protein [Salmonella enterica]
MNRIFKVLWNAATG